MSKALAKNLPPAPEGMTYTTGYYNPNSYDLQIGISKYNLTIPLSKGKFVIDRNGHQINDPILDSYKQLAKETSDTPVPMVTFAPPVEHKPMATHDGQSVMVVTEYTEVRGKKVPVMPVPRQTTAADVNKPSHMGMSVDEARKLGYIGRKVIEVPDDYGVTDTDGAPSRNAPPIRNAMESKPTRAETQLPAQAFAAMTSKGDVNARRAIQKGMVAESQSTNPAESESGFLRAAQAAAAKLGIGKAPAPAIEPVLEDAPDELPDAVPDVSDAAFSAPATGIEVGEEPEFQQQTVQPAVAPVKTGIVCMECGITVADKSRLLSHATKQHPDKVKAIMMACS